MLVFRLIAAKIHKKHEIQSVGQDYFPFRAQKHTVRLFQKRLVLISEAPRAYLGSTSCLSRKRPVLISEAPRAYFGSAARLLASQRTLYGEASRCQRKSFGKRETYFFAFFYKKKRVSLVI